MEIQVKIFNDDGDEVTHDLPARYEVCETCRGTGTHLRGGLRDAVYSREDMEEDPDFFDAMRQGEYDQVCSRCDGKRVVLQPDAFQMNAEQSAIYNKYLERLREEIEYRREVEAERRMGA